MKRFVVPVCIAALAAAAIGCEASKSSNPLTPTVAGPLPGVEIGAPKTLEPANAKIAVAEQPVTLLAENTGSSGPRPLTYVFEVATDSSFNNRVFVRENVAPGDGGRTAIRLPDPLAPERTYFWRSRAQDGANTGPYSSAANFEIFTPIVIDPPNPTSPAVNAIGQPVRPTLVAANVFRSGPVGALSYMFEVSETDSFANKIGPYIVPEGSSQTSVAVAQDLAYNKIYFWHVRAFDSKTSGPWSATRAFQTAAQVVAPPGGGGGGGGTGKPCGPPYPNNGPAIIACISNQYPEKLVAGVSLSQRISNMEFLRNRIIETGICGGMDLGLNLKRGGPEISIDAIVHRHGSDEIIDIGAAYDDTNIPLRLQWATTTFPFYKTYTPRPAC